MVKKEGRKLVIVGIIYILGLLAYLFITTNFVLPIQILLLAMTFYLSYLIAKKISSANNKFFVKLYFCFIINAFLFFLVLFFCFAGRALYGDTEAILSQLIVPFSTALFGIATFITEIQVLSKRGVEKKTKYNLSILNLLLTILVIIFVGLFYYNSAILKIADNQDNPDPKICKNMIIIPNSVLFDPSSEVRCSLWSTESTLDERQCENLCTLYPADCNQLKSSCYNSIALLKNDVSFCFKGLEFNMAEVDSCIAHTAKDISTCNYLFGGKNYNSKIGAPDSMYNLDFCLSLLAPKVGDKNICNSINDTEFKQGCLEDYDSERQRYLEEQ